MTVNYHLCNLDKIIDPHSLDILPKIKILSE